MTRQLLIDADFTLFMACAAVERESRFPNENDDIVHVVHSDRAEARANFERMVKGYVRDLRADEAVLVFSGPNNFRKEVWDGYKANRKATRKPLCYWDVIADVREAGDFRVVSEDCLEGDDYIGILATRPSSVERIIVSDDKDMQTLPNVKLWRMGQIIETDDASAEEFWLYQTLMGDTTDGYKVCPGIFPVAAKKVLEKPGDPWTNVVEAYRAAYAKDKDPTKAKWLDRSPKSWRS
ncbi:hypothetical protein ACFSHP_12155 [Novosphingobium panipatense]